MSMTASGIGVPLAERMRPSSLEEVVGQEHLLGPGCLLSGALKSGRVFSTIFWGPPGSGKTTIARLIGEYTRFPFRSFSAVTSGVKELRQIVDEAVTARASFDTPTLLFVDEIHRFNKAQQDAFLPHVESGLIMLIGATTQNPSFEVISPLLSRARVMVLRPLGPEHIKALLSRALEDKDRGLGTVPVEVSEEALDHLVTLSQGDARVALNNLETVAAHAMSEGGGVPVAIDLERVEKALDRKALPYDKDGEEHYNIISAFHKSMRGSDVHASLYWLYRMLDAGEDPLFIARRMIRFASEDVGLADPRALRVALDAFDTWSRVGPPEARLALAQAAVYLAAAPKSNALYVSEKAVQKEIGRSGNLPVPFHIRNAPTALMKKLGYGRGYRYPHNYPGARVAQEYLPEGLRGREFFKPTGRGFEREIRARLAPAVKK